MQLLPAGGWAGFPFLPLGGLKWMPVLATLRPCGPIPGISSTGARAGFHGWLHSLSSHLVLSSHLYFHYTTHCYDCQHPTPEDCGAGPSGQGQPSKSELGWLLLFTALHPYPHPHSQGLFGVLVLLPPLPT